MHRVAEHGIAAHWKYKEGEGRERRRGSFVAAQPPRVAERAQGPDQFVETVKIDLFQDEVYVFTPKGDVPTSRGLDAHRLRVRIHSQVGHCSGARVNGRIVPLRYELRNGDIVEIVTTEAPHGPSRDWLGFVKSASAKERIRDRALLGGERFQLGDLALQLGDRLFEIEIGAHPAWACPWGNGPRQI